MTLLFVLIIIAAGVLGFLFDEYLAEKKAEKGALDEITKTKKKLPEYVYYDSICDKIHVLPDKLLETKTLVYLGEL